MSKVSRGRKKPAKKTKRKSRRGKLTPMERIGAMVASYAVVFAGLGIAGVVGILWAGGYLQQTGSAVGRWTQGITTASGFAIERVTVVGRAHTSDSAIVEALAADYGASLLHFDADAARKRVEELGWVRAAAVSRLWPDTVHVSIRERQPIAIWQASGELRLVDADGAVIDVIKAGEYSALPIIIGAGAPQAASEILRDLETAPGVRQRLAALERIDDRHWNLRLRSGLEIRLPEHDFGATLAEVERLQDAHGTLDRDLEYLDFRNPDKIVIHPLADASASRGR